MATMRQLHPVSFHEKFVASGTYTFYAGNLPSGDLQHWSLNEPGSGSRTFRADHDGRAGTGANWLLEGLGFVVHDPHVERFDVQVMGERTTLATYVFSESAVEISRRLDGDTLELETVPLPAGIVVSPPSLVAQLAFVPRHAGQTVNVFAADFEVKSGLVKGGHVSKWTVEPLGSSQQPLGNEHIACDEYRVNGEHGVDLRCWFDAHGTLIRYDHANGERALLTQYVRRQDPQS